MDGDTGLRENITGLSPNKEKHSSEFIVQPESGLPLSISVKVQINMHFKDLSAYSRLRRFNHLTVPMLWFEIMMPKLPKNLDNRFNFYLNYLPYIDPIGFWGGLLAGVGLLIYAITSATLRMSSLTKTPHRMEANYGRPNLLQTNNGVYKPCEMKLITTNEKPNVILRNSGHEADNIYTELHPTTRTKRGSFALELEPALESSIDTSSSDEGNESDTATLSLSRDSSSSCCHAINNCCIDEFKADSSNSNSTADEDCEVDGDGEQQMGHSIKSGNYRTSLTVPNEDFKNKTTTSLTKTTSIQK